MESQTTTSNRLFSHPLRQTVLTIVMLLVIMTVSSWGFLLLENNQVFARFSLAGDLASTEKQISRDIDSLEDFDATNVQLPQFKTRLEEFSVNRNKTFYSDQLFEEVQALFQDVNTALDEQQSKWFNRIDDTISQTKTKFEELKNYGVSLPMKEEELAMVERRFSTAATAEDFRLIDTLSQQLSSFLQDQINVKKMIYLQSHLKEELSSIQSLLDEGKKLGIENKDLSNAVASLNLNQSASSSASLLQLEKYQEVLVDGKIQLKDSIEKKKKEQEEQKNRTNSNYIAIVPQHYPIGGKSIEVSLSEQVLRMYENGEQIHADFVVTGKNGWETTPGVHHILYKQLYKVLSMDKPVYYRIPVKYWMPFTTSGEGIHDLTSRWVFGPRANRSWNGSHGCVNSPIALAALIFQWAEVGTPVVVF